mmetsp:Transcript_17094/g.42396  ORF Transcript_17094/g.42396 Transcript_17094/m.42396 type:complete len:258 (-) Transcript_17094:1019-1792(-)
MHHQHAGRLVYCESLCESFSRFAGFAVVVCVEVFFFREAAEAVGELHRRVHSPRPRRYRQAQVQKHVEGPGLVPAHAAAGLGQQLAPEDVVDRRVAVAHGVSPPAKGGVVHRLALDILHLAVLRLTFHAVQVFVQTVQQEAQGLVRVLLRVAGKLGRVANDQVAERSRRKHGGAGRRRTAHLLEKSRKLPRKLALQRRRALVQIGLRKTLAEIRLQLRYAEQALYRGVKEACVAQVPQSDQVSLPAAERRPQLCPPS